MRAPSSDVWTAARAIDPCTPLAVLDSAGAGPWSAHSLCARAHGVLRIDRSGARWTGDAPHPAGAPPRDPLDALAWAHDARRWARDIDGCPAAGGWIAVLSYELGELLEPAVARGAGPEDDRAAPLADLLWCPEPTLFPAGRTPGGEGLVPCDARQSEPDADGHVGAVRRTVELIRAGDIFQANIARRLHLPVRGDSMAWARRAIHAARAPFGAMVRLPSDGPDRIVTSMSPELFLHVSKDGVITTRPIKGTSGAGESPAALEASSKDMAELHMIVDLVRNDLGRVCTMGSVRVPTPRSLETHGTVHHGVAEVRGTLRDDVGLVELLRATFPPGSVTGAPKIRAMQIIRELEPRPRGPYCGAIGLLGPHGCTMLSVGIRTAVLHGSLDGHRFSGTLDYGTGGGITAQSDPLAELGETELKARALGESLTRSAAGHPPADPAPREATAATRCGDAVDWR